MLTYDITDTGSYSLYEYLYKCIKNDISSGKIKAGDKLPSKRSFAKNLGISVITIERAYEQLIAEGYIYSVAKKGYYVSDMKQLLIDDISDKKFNIKSNDNKLNDSESEDTAFGNSKEQYRADFSSNQTESKVFPFSIWSKVVREVLSDNRMQLMTNPPVGGIIELRKAISDYLREFRGMNASPRQIIIGAGTEYLYSLLIQLLGRNHIFAVENPGYHKIAKIYDNMNVKCEYIDIDDSGVIISEMEEKEVDIINVSPSHHFPTGIVMPISRKYELLGWASGKEDRYIIEDDYDSELRLSGKPIPTLQSIDVSDKVIYINTFSKTLASTVRISYMVLPETLADKYYKELSFYSCTVSNFEQYTLADFIENGSFEKHVNRLRNYYQNKKNNILEQFSANEIGKYITITGEEAGVHFLMHIDTEKSEKEIVQCAKKNGIKLIPLSEYYKNDNYPEKHYNTYVMNYSSINMEFIGEVADLLYRIITGRGCPPPLSESGGDE